MPIDNMTKLESRAVRYAFDVEIKASPSKVWGLLTSDIHTWWPEHFHSGPNTKRFVVEPKVGGRVYEDLGSDGGVLWGIVLQFDPEKRLQIKGALFPDYGGPGEYHLSIKLDESPEGCKLVIDDALLGVISDDLAESLETGWKELFGKHLKEKAEA